MTALATGLLAVLAVVAAGARLQPPRRLPGAPRQRMATEPPVEAGPATTQRRRRRVGIRRPSGRARAVLVGAVAVLLVPALGPLPIAIAAGVALRATAARRRAQRLRERELVGAVADTADLLVAAVAAGLTPYAALERTHVLLPAPVDREVADVLALVAHGVRLADALDTLPARLGDTARPLARILSSADRHGTPLGPALELLAVECRAARRRQGEEAARRLPVRLSFPLVVCFLPALALCTVVPLLAGTLRSLPA